MDTLDIKEKITLFRENIQKIIGCGRNNTYALIANERRDNLFVVKQIGNKYYIPAESIIKVDDLDKVVKYKVFLFKDSPELRTTMAKYHYKED